MAIEATVMISAGVYGVYSELDSAFRDPTGYRLVTTRGASMGDSPRRFPPASREGRSQMS
jgi:hypothetical protein